MALLLTISLWVPHAVFLHLESTESKIPHLYLQPRFRRLNTCCATKLDGFHSLNMMENVRFLLSHVTSMSMIELWSYHDYPPVMYEFAMEAMAQMTKMMIYGTNKWYQMVMFVLSNHRVYVRANTSFRPTSPLGLRFYGLRSRVLAFSCFAFRVFPWFCHCLLMFLEFKVEGLRF